MAADRNFSSVPIFLWSEVYYGSSQELLIYQITTLLSMACI